MSTMAMQMTPNGSGGMNERGNRPAPLELVGVGGREAEALGREELLSLMASIQAAVKNAALDPHLAALIFKLYHQLKIQGHILEQTNKNEMSRVFVSLRQACCRDSGQLGTPCRLKIMELVELRAMGWRPNLAHSQYYLHHPPNQPAASINNMSHVGHQMGNMQLTNSAYMPQDMDPNKNSMGPGPVSAPPFGTIPMNPFGFAMPPPPPQAAQHPIISQHQPHFHSLADLGGMTMSGGMAMGGGGAGSFYLVPHPSFQAMGMMPPSPMGPPLGLRPAPQTSPTGREAVTTPSDWPRGAVIRASPKLSAPQRVPGKNQFRDEIIIRNPDSGKIMGVKGRRVAVVEALTKTVISFQKVPTGAKERTLTLTASTEEEIAYAKKLIEETIRRNVSPNRGDDGEELVMVGEGGVVSEEAVEERGGGGGDWSSLLSGGGLRLECDDPEMLAAAQEALADYFQRSAPMRRSQGNVASSRTAAERDLRRERRKSMPSFPPELVPVIPAAAAAAAATTAGAARADADRDWRRGVFLPPMGESAERATTESPKGLGGAGLGGAAAKSTPDLRAPPTAVGRLGMRVVYTKDYLLKCAGSPLAICAPANRPHIVEEAPEIIRESPGRFSTEEYRQRAAVCKAAAASVCV